MAFSLGHGADLGQRLLGRRDEFGALARALGRQLGVATDDETLAGIVVRGDLRHVALVEQRELQRAALGRQGLDGRGAQRGDPIEAGRLEVGVDARLGDHAAIADQHDALQPKGRKRGAACAPDLKACSDRRDCLRRPRWRPGSPPACTNADSVEAGHALNEPDCVGGEALRTIDACLNMGIGLGRSGGAPCRGQATRSLQAIP